MKSFKLKFNLVIDCNCRQTSLYFTTLISVKKKKKKQEFNGRICIIHVYFSLHFKRHYIIFDTYKRIHVTDVEIIKPNNNWPLMMPPHNIWNGILVTPLHLLCIPTLSYCLTPQEVTNIHNFKCNILLTTVLTKFSHTYLSLNNTLCLFFI